MPEPHPDFNIDELPPWEPRPDEQQWVRPIDWAAFWSIEQTAEDWLIEPVIAAGRQTAIYSAAKTGKSLLALDIAAAAATGRSVLGYSPREPISVMYVDLEMTEADLRERLCVCARCGFVILPRQMTVNLHRPSRYRRLCGVLLVSSTPLSLFRRQPERKP